MPRPYSWLGEPVGVIQPTHRVPGEFREAWAARLERPVPGPHVSTFHAHSPACLGDQYDDKPEHRDGVSMRFQQCRQGHAPRFLGFSRDFDPLPQPARAGR